MTNGNATWLAHQRKRFMRPDAWRWLPPKPLARPRPAINVETLSDAAALKAERAELVALKALLADIRFHVVLRRFARKYREDQPRDDHGRWVDDPQQSLDPLPVRLSGQVIPICIAGSRSIFTDQRGNKSFKVIYECAGGRTLVLTGIGDRFPGIRIDPFR